MQLCEYKRYAYIEQEQNASVVVRESSQSVCALPDTPHPHGPPDSPPPLSLLPRLREAGLEEIDPPPPPAAWCRAAKVSPLRLEPLLRGASPAPTCQISTRL